MWTMIVKMESKERNVISSEEIVFDKLLPKMWKDFSRIIAPMIELVKLWLL